MLDSLTSIKKMSLALGVAGMGVFAGLPALAQSSSSPTAAPEFELSKEGFIILCDRTPLNSRCEGSPYYTGSSSQSPTENPAFSPSGTTAPTQNLPSETDVEPSSAGETRSPDGMMQDGSSSGSGSNDSNGSGLNDGSNTSGTDSDNTTGSPSNTTAPTENLPSESDPQSPSSRNQSPNGMGQSGSSGSSESLGSPSNTTAPTQTLPSESGNK